jgi:hypothetical protein
MRRDAYKGGLGKLTSQPLEDRSGDLPIDTEPFALSAPLEAVECLLCAMARNKQLDKQMEALTLGDHMLGDNLCLDLSQVNLAANAILFTHPGRAVLILVCIPDETCLGSFAEPFQASRHCA